ncbi:MAG: glycosyltransferase [Paludibacter sp.]
MLSIIICSRNKTLSQDLKNNIEHTIGVDYELVHIDNSENKYSIFAAYNLGITKSKFPYLCFIHEDVLFHSNNWGINVIAHLQDPKTGILGVAGGDLLTKVPASWATLISPSQNIIQTDLKKNKTVLLLHPENYTLSKRSSITLDGIFLSMRKEITEKIYFDENLKGFHGYDYDISIQASIAGHVNYVIYDIQLEHFSKGKTDILYFRNLISIYKKWENFLPVIGLNVTENERHEINKIEKIKLLQLTKKMVRKGFEITEIISEITYYANRIGYLDAIRNLKFRIFIIRLFNCPKYLFRK